MPPLRTSVLLAFLLGGCLTNGASEPAGSGSAGPPPSATLEFDGRQLVLEQGGERRILNCDGQPVPYTVQAEAPMLLATALLPGLKVLTVAAARDTDRPELHTYTEELPVTCKPCVVLASLPDPLTGAVSACRVLSMDGSSAWASESGVACEYLPPQAAGSTSDQRLFFVESSPGEPTLPYAMDARLLWLDGIAPPVSANSTSLNLAGAAAGVELLAVAGQRALVLVLYNYEALELQLLDLGATEGVLARWQLSGQPLSQAVFPGPSYQWSKLELDGSVLSIAVMDSREQAAQLWQIDLLRAERNISGLDQALPTAVETINDVDSLGSVPFAQDILPDCRMDKWKIHAARDVEQCVLLVTVTGAANWTHAHLEKP